MSGILELEIRFVVCSDLGKDWFYGFMARHPEISRRTPQALNEARAQKLNKPLITDYFDKLKDLLLELDIIDKPERIFNMDEKGIRMCQHKKNKVLAKKGSRRVHSRGKEHGENVTAVCAGSALGLVVPPMILFKGQKRNDRYKEVLPVGCALEMTEKGSMTIPKFVLFIEHLAKFKPAGELLNFHTQPERKKLRFY